MADSTYSGAIDTWDDLVDGTDEITASWGNKIQDAHRKQQTALGVNIEGAHASLAARLTAIEQILS